MIVLADGTLLYNHDALREYLEGVGFDCWNMQKDELLHMLGGEYPDEIINSMQDDIDELNDELTEKDNRIFELEQETDDYREELERLEGTILELKEKMSSTGIEID